MGEAKFRTTMSHLILVSMWSFCQFLFVGAAACIGLTQSRHLRVVSGVAYGINHKLLGGYIVTQHYIKISQMIIEIAEWTIRYDTIIMVD